MQHWCLGFFTALGHCGLDYEKSTEAVEKPVPIWQIRDKSDQES